MGRSGRGMQPNWQAADRPAHLGGAFHEDTVAAPDALPARRQRVPTKGAQTRQAILRAAIARFGRDGYRASSVADIARDAGVGGTLVYAYFSSKEALFLAALDDDAAALIGEGLSHLDEVVDVSEWRMSLFFTLVAAVEQHPLAKRVLGGLEPGVTDRVHEIPSLAELQKALADRLRSDQIAGTVRDDIAPDRIATGVVAIVLSLLMSVVQLGPQVADVYGDDVEAVFAAAVDRLPAQG